MSNLPSIICVEAAWVDPVNAVFAACGKGEGTVSRACVAADNDAATWETPATYYIAQDMSAQSDEVAEWQAMCSGGNLPDISPNLWGQSGIISSQDAQAALVHMTVASEAGLGTPQEVENFLAGILLGKGLKFRPDPPLF